MALRVVGVVQARFTSTRLPGKILKTLRGRPSLEYLMDGLSHAQQLDSVVLATSTHASDDATTAFASERRIRCYRGSLEDVARRILHAAQEQEAHAVVRINGDSPLLDPRIVDHAVTLFREKPVDLVTNVCPRSFPKGQSVEVIALDALGRAVAIMKAAEELEHVTPYIYSHPEDFSIRSFTAAVWRPEVQLSIDTESDFERCGEILDLLGAPPWQAGWQACVAAYDRCVAAGQAQSLPS